MKYKGLTSSFDLSAIAGKYDYVRENDNAPLIAVPKSEFLNFKESEKPLLFEQPNVSAVDDLHGKMLVSLLDTFLEEVSKVFFSPKSATCYPLEQILLNFEEKPSKLFDKIDALLDDEDGDYDDEFLIPTEHAINEMKSLISEIYCIFGNAIDFVKFLPNGKGGVEAVFRKNGRILHLIAPSKGDKNPYLFHKEQSTHKIEQISDTKDLIFWVKWLLEA